MKNLNKNLIIASCVLCAAILCLTILSFVGIINFYVSSIISFFAMSAFYSAFAIISKRSKEPNIKYINYLTKTALICFGLALLFTTIVFVV